MSRGAYLNHMGVEPTATVRDGRPSSLVFAAPRVRRVLAYHRRALVLGFVVVALLSLITVPAAAGPASIAADGFSSSHPATQHGDPPHGIRPPLGALENTTNATTFGSLEPAPTGADVSSPDTDRTAATVTTTTDTVVANNQPRDVETSLTNTTQTGAPAGTDNGLNASSEAATTPMATPVSVTANGTGDTITTTAPVHFTVGDALGQLDSQSGPQPRRSDTARSASTPQGGEPPSDRLTATPVTPDNGEIEQSADGGDGATGAGSDAVPPPTQRSKARPPGLSGVVGAGVLLVIGWRCSSAGGLATIGHSGAVDKLSSVGYRHLTGWLDRLRPVLGLAGYQRYEDDDPLVHPLRGTLYDRIQTEPGTYLSALADATETPLGTVRYHLKILEFEGLVTRADLNGRRRYYPLDVEPGVIETLLEDSAALAVLEELATSAATVGELADRVDRDPSTITHHTTRLADMGLVERERDGRTTRNRLTDEGRAAVRSARTTSHSVADPAQSIDTSTD